MGVTVCLVLLEKSPGMEVMLTQPIYILMGWISHGDPPSPMHGFRFN